MKLGRSIQLTCGHATSTYAREFDFDKMHEMVETNDELDYLHFCSIDFEVDQHYCPTCNGMRKAKRVNIFVIERDVGEIT